MRYLQRFQWTTLSKLSILSSEPSWKCLKPTTLAISSCFRHRVKCSIRQAQCSCSWLYVLRYLCPNRSRHESEFCIFQVHSPQMSTLDGTFRPPSIHWECSPQDSTLFLGCSLFRGFTVWCANVVNKINCYSCHMDRNRESKLQNLDKKWPVSCRFMWQTFATSKVNSRILPISPCSTTSTTTTTRWQDSWGLGRYGRTPGCWTSLLLASRPFPSSSGCRTKNISFSKALSWQKTHWNNACGASSEALHASQVDRLIKWYTPQNQHSPQK